MFSEGCTVGNISISQTKHNIPARFTKVWSFLFSSHSRAYPTPRQVSVRGFNVVAEQCKYLYEQFMNKFINIHFDQWATKCESAQNCNTFTEPNYKQLRMRRRTSDVVTPITGLRSVRSKWPQFHNLKPHESIRKDSTSSNSFLWQLVP